MKMTGVQDYVLEGRKLIQSRIYNGFTWEERIAVNPAQRAARRHNNPLVCSVTGFSMPQDPKGSGYIFTHLEDYRKPVDWLPVSKRTHRMLHARFVDPRAWFNFVAEHYVHGAWWTMMVMSPVQCRRKFDMCYPQGLPGDGEYWEEFATAAGLSRELFLSPDIRVPLRALWRFPVITKESIANVA